MYRLWKIDKNKFTQKMKYINLWDWINNRLVRKSAMLTRNKFLKAVDFLCIATAQKIFR